MSCKGVSLLKHYTVSLFGLFQARTSRINKLLLPPNIPEDLTSNNNTTKISVPARPVVLAESYIRFRLPFFS